MNARLGNQPSGVAFVAAALALFIAADGYAQKPKTLDELVSTIKAGSAAQSKELAAREAEFRADKSRQAKLLKEAKAALADAEAKTAQLERAFRDNEVKIEESKKTLKDRLGTMNELFGELRKVAGDTAEEVRASIVSAERPGRVEALRTLASSKALPDIPELENLWTTILDEMVQSGKVTRFQADVLVGDGTKAKQSVVRVGGFNVVSDQGYLAYKPEDGQLSVLARQPPDRFVATTNALLTAEEGPVRFALDPARGRILELLMATRTYQETLAQGGAVGYIIIGLGLFALLVGLVRYIGLTYTSLKINSQLRSSSARTDNPLGRVLKVYEDNRGIEPEDLERKLDEVIVRESGRAERFIWIVKVVAGAAPLLGLLGTVTGMIRTFQAITLFGTGDPKLMAGGISEALVTTMLGLIVAVPTVLMYAALTNSSKRLVDIIEEQAAGMVARRAEADVEGGVGG